MFYNGESHFTLLTTKQNFKIIIIIIMTSIIQSTLHLKLQNKCRSDCQQHFSYSHIHVQHTYTVVTGYTCKYKVS